MIPSFSTFADKTLPVSERDAQWLTAINAVCVALICDKDEEAARNINAMRRLLVLYYSADEAEELKKRIHALLPANTPLTLVDPRLSQVARDTVHVS